MYCPRYFVARYFQFEKLMSLFFAQNATGDAKDALEVKNVNCCAVRIEEIEF